MEKGSLLAGESPRRRAIAPPRLLYQLAGGHLKEAQPPLQWLLAVIPATLIAVAAVTAIPARLGARRPVAELLRTE